MRTTSRFTPRMRLLSALLTLAMLFGLAPVSTFADEPAQTTQTTFCMVAGTAVTEENKDNITGDDIHSSGKVTYDSTNDSTNATLRFGEWAKLGSEETPCTDYLFHYYSNAVTIEATGTVEGWTEQGGFFMPYSINSGSYILRGTGSGSGLYGYSSTEPTVVKENTTVELDGFATGLSSGGVDISGTVIIRNVTTGINDGGKTLKPGGTLEIHAEKPIGSELNYEGGHLILESTGTDEINLKTLNINATGDLWFRTDPDGSFVKQTAEQLKNSYHFTVGTERYLELTELADVDPDANTAYSLWVSGKRVTDRNADDVLGDGTVSFDASAHTLTLKDAVLEQPQNDGPWEAAIETGLPLLTITGRATFQNGNGIHSEEENQDVELRDARLTFDAAAGLEDGIKLPDSALTVDNSEICFTGETEDCGVYALWAGKRIDLRNSTVTIRSTGSDGELNYDNGLQTEGQLTVENCQLDLNTSDSAIWADTMEVSDGRTHIEAYTSLDGCGIELDDEDALTLHDGLAVLEGKVNDSRRVVIGCAHEYDLHTWSSDSETHWHACKHCGAKTDEERHSLDGTGLCTVCGYETTGKETDASGDDSHTEAVLAAVAVGTVVVGSGILLARYYIKSNLPEGTAIPATRKELAVVLWQMAGCPEPAGQTLYADLPEAEREAAKAARWAVENGLLTPDSEASFGADAKVNQGTVLRAMLRTERVMKQNKT